MFHQAAGCRPHAPAELAEFASYGASGVDIAAPGLVETTVPGNEFRVVAGTSVATPKVARVAAMIKGAYPELSYLDIRNCLLDGAHANSNFTGRVAGSRQLDETSALLCAASKSEAIRTCEPDSVNVSEYLSADVVYKSDKSIISNAHIEAAANVIYTAAKRIVLTAGFHAEAGALFHGFIQGCSFSPLVADPPRLKEVAETLPEPIEVGAILLEAIPNPVHSEAIVWVFLPVTQRVQLALYDLGGRPVAILSEAMAHAGWSQSRLERGALPAGIYFLRLHTPDQVITRKLVFIQN